MTNSTSTGTAHIATNQVLEKITHNVSNFVENDVIPMETFWLQKKKHKEDILSPLLAESLRRNLWGLFYPLPYGGKIDTLENYLSVAEQEGRSELSQPLFGCQSAVDAHMLARFAQAQIQDIFLKPMTTAQAVPGYGMSEPDQPGSVPAQIKMRARKQGGQWIINGKKWFICNARQATFFTVVACTNPDATASQAFSMLLVPTDSAGFRVEGGVSVLGRNSGQGVLSFDNVRVPLHYMIGEPGQGMALIKQRLSMGRLLRSMHWIGMAQRCFDMMGQRIYTPKSKAAGLENKQLIKQLFFTTHQRISSAREILRLAARQVDRQNATHSGMLLHDATVAYQAADTSTRCSTTQTTPSLTPTRTASAQPDINTQAHCAMLVSSAKVACANALYAAADAAVQIYGAEGLTDQTPLADLFRAARATRIMDGADEALISSAGGQLIHYFRDNPRFLFSTTDSCR